MGLFSDEEEIYVATTVQRVIPDDKIQSSVQTGSLKAIFAHGEISDYVMADMASGIGARASSYYRYGRDNYIYGLPSGQSTQPDYATPIVESIIEAIEGQQVAMTYCYFGPMTYAHLCWKQIFGMWPDYNPVTYEIPTLTANYSDGTKQYLYNPVQITAADETIDALSPSAMIVHDLPVTFVRNFNTQYTYGPIGTSLLVTPYQNPNPADYPNGVIRGDSYNGFTDDVRNYPASDEYFQVKYVVGGRTKFWQYKIGSGTYPQLDNAFTGNHQPTGSYFPFAYFRYNKTQMDADTSSYDYISSKRLVDRLGLNYASMVSSIGQNPNIADVEQVMLFMAVPPDSTNGLEQRYLYEYFDNLFYMVNGRGTSLSEAQVNAGYAFSPDVSGAVVIQDARFKMALSHNGMYRRVVNGSIGPVGAYASATYIAQIPLPSDGVTQTAYYGTIPVQMYRKQISDWQYEEIQILNLTMRYYVWGYYNTTGDDQQNKSILLVPLDLSITQTFTLKEREELYARSLHYVFNSRVVVTLHWYQQDWFSFVMVVAAVVLAIYTGGDSLQLVAAQIAAGAMTVQAFFILVATKVIETLIVSELIKLFVKAVGIKIAFIVAVIAIAYGFYDAYSNGGFAASPTAQQLVNAGNGLVKGVNSNMQDLLSGVQSDMQALNSEEAQNNALIEDANKLLETKNYLSPYTFFGETPQNYFDRTVHSGNIGIMGLDAVSNYVERSLSLPTLPATFGGIAQ